MVQTKTATLTIKALTKRNRKVCNAAGQKNSVPEQAELRPTRRGMINSDISNMMNKTAPAMIFLFNPGGAEEVSCIFSADTSLSSQSNGVVEMMRLSVILGSILSSPMI